MHSFNKGRIRYIAFFALMAVLMLIASCRSEPERQMSIRIETEVSYARGDGFLSDDFTVIATMPDGTEKDVSAAASFNRPDGYLISDDTEISATYNGASAIYTIVPRGDVVGIMVATEPERLVYDEDNNRISYNGLTLMTLSTSGISKVIPYGDPRLDVSIEQGTTIVGDVEVEVVYMDTHVAKLNLIYEGDTDVYATGISITGYPRQDYQRGEEFDISNLTVLATWSDGSVSVVDNENLVISPVPGTILNESVTATVEYNDNVASFPIRITEEAVISDFELVEKADYAGYLSYAELSEGFDMKGLLVRAIYSDGTSEVLGDEDLVWSDSPVQGRVAISVTDSSATGYTVSAIYDALEVQLYQELYSTVSSLSVVSEPEDIMFSPASFADGTAFRGLGLVVYAEYTGGRTPEFLEPGDNGFSIYAVDNTDGTWTAFAEYGGSSVRIGDYEFMPEPLSTGLTLVDSLGREIQVDNAMNIVSMLNDGNFKVTIGMDVSDYTAEWYVNGEKYEVRVGEEPNTFYFEDFELGGHYVITGIFTDGTPMGAGSVSFAVEITKAPAIVEA